MARARIASTTTLEEIADGLAELGELEEAHLGVEDARRAIALFPPFFERVAVESGYMHRAARAITTKFRDAGRRSPPWRPASGRVPGRPQDGADGNRRLRWLFDEDHKFYADELAATLVEIRYYLQALSMDDAPHVPHDALREAWHWLAGHPIEPGAYRDPIQLVPISFPWVMEDARRVQSGHLVPLDRGGRHEPSNAFLMLARSNQLQGNQTLDELIQLMTEVVARHRISGPQEPTVQV
jgi:hypothetical protein